jgi:hypothetical protein
LYTAIEGKNETNQLSSSMSLFFENSILLNGIFPLDMKFE